LLLQHASAAFAAAAAAAASSATRHKLFHLAFQVGWHLNEVITKVAARKSESQPVYNHDNVRKNSDKQRKE